MFRRNFVKPLLVFVIVSVFLAPAHSSADFRLNHLQVLGTHNSYKMPANVSWLNYSQPALDAQLNSKVRTLEIDLHLQSDGVLHVYHLPDIDTRSHCATFAECLSQIHSWMVSHSCDLPLFVHLDVKSDQTSSDGCPAAQMWTFATCGVQFCPVKQDQLIECLQANCRRYVDMSCVGSLPCLSAAAASLPPDAIFDDQIATILINQCHGNDALLNNTNVRTVAALIDSDIHHAFPSALLITPTQVRGSHDSLIEAVHSGSGWPTIESSRNKIIFYSDLLSSFHDINETQYVFFSIGSCNSTGSAVIRSCDIADDLTASLAQNTIIFSNIDSYSSSPNISQLNELHTSALATGIHLIKTDNIPEAVAINHLPIEASFWFAPRYNQLAIEADSCSVVPETTPATLSDGPCANGSSNILAAGLVWNVLVALGVAWVMIASRAV